MLQPRILFVAPMESMKLKLEYETGENASYDIELAKRYARYMLKEIN